MTCSTDIMLPFIQKGGIVWVWILLLFPIQRFPNFKDFSSPEPKVKWAYLNKICPFSVVVVVFVSFPHFHLLLQNHSANFYQTWYKASQSQGDSSLFKWRATRFSKGRLLWNCENALMKFKNLLKNTWPIWFFFTLQINVLI